MIINPIIPIWVMVIICVILVLLRPKDKFKFIREIIIILLLFVINLRIMIPSEKVQYVDNNLDILFVIDNSISIVAEDYNGTYTRLSAIKKDCEYLINQLSGSKFSIITFDNIAQVALPYTKDTNTAIEVINAMGTTSELYAKGSSLNAPRDLIIETLKLADEKRNQIIFFISDGEDNLAEIESFSEIKKYIEDGAVLGYGTDAGGKMRVKNSYYDNFANYIIDRTEVPYKEAVSKIDENNLKKIANDLNVDYIHMTKQSNIDSKIKSIRNSFMNQSLSSDNTKTSYADTYYVLTEIVCFLLVIEFINYKRRI